MLRFLLTLTVMVGFVACSDDGSTRQKLSNDVEEKSRNVDNNNDIAESVLQEEVTKDAGDTITDGTTQQISTNDNETQKAETGNDKKPDVTSLYAKCAACHGKDGKSVAPGSVGNVLIASLNKAQVRDSLKGFRERTLSKGGNSVIMYMQTKNLSDEDIEALAAYIDSF